MNPDPVLENVRLAVACGADPAMILAVALASAQPQSLDEAFALLDARRDAIRRLALDPGTLERLAPLEPALQYEPELARLRMDIGDHEVRGRLVFGELLGKKSFFQVAALAIAGLELTASDGELLGDHGVLTQLADPRIWPLAITRRVAASGGGLAHAVVAGVASLCNRNMAALPVGGFMRFLDRVERAMEDEGRTLHEVLDDVLARRERIAGVGRPVFGVDERVPHMLALNERFGRGDGPSLQLALAIDTYLFDRKGLRLNSAGLQGALLRDLGFSPSAAGALCLLYFMLPVLAHAVFPEEKARAQGDPAPAPPVQGGSPQRA